MPKEKDKINLVVIGYVDSSKIMIVFFRLSVKLTYQSFICI